jgi:hypothetical protein
MIVIIIQGLRKEGNKKSFYCEGDCGHVALWNFKLCFEPSCPPPLTSGINDLVDQQFAEQQTFTRYKW